LQTIQIEMIPARTIPLPKHPIDFSSERQIAQEVSESVCFCHVGIW
jgi:hypothetical protein